MKKIFHKIAAIGMAFVVLFSTMSFTVQMHYCGDILIDSAVFQEVKDCGMQMGKNTSTTSFQKENCCNDKEIAIEGQDTLKNTSKNLTFKQQIFVATFLYTYKNILKERAKTTSFKNGDPPPIAIEIYKLHEVYLI